jgi:hypothetical protein
LQIQPGVKTVLQTFNQRRNPASRFHPQTLHDPFRINDGKMAPRLDIGIDRHTQNILPAPFHTKFP